MFSVYSAARTVEEIVELHTSVGVIRTLFRTKLTCSFVTPVVKFSEDTINFRVEMVATVICVFSPRSLFLKIMKIVYKVIGVINNSDNNC